MGAGLLGGMIGNAIDGPVGRLIGSAIGAGLGQVVTNKLQGRPWDEGLLFNVGLSVATEGAMMGAEQWARGGTADYVARATEERSESSTQWKEYAFDGSDVEMELVSRKQKGGLPAKGAENEGIVRLFDPEKDRVAFEEFMQAARAYNETKGRESLYTYWKDTLDDLTLTDEIHTFVRDDKITGAVLVQDLGAEAAIETVGKPALYFSLFETIGTDPAAGSALLRRVYSLSMEKGYNGFLYGSALKQALPRYQRYGAVPIHDARENEWYTFFDPTNPKVRKILGLP